jgi:SAM-dependent methyltransferase
MDWIQYRKVVHSSRAVIAIPIIKQYLANATGTGIDLGCGDGEIVASICSKGDVSIIGVDIDKSLVKRARERKLEKARFLEADLSLRPIRKIGIYFDFAYSNCCLNHLADREVAPALDDLRASLKENAKIILLVPHWKRAASNYKQIKELPNGNGVTGIPDYGVRQFF